MAANSHCAGGEISRRKIVIFEGRRRRQTALPGGFDCRSVDRKVAFEARLIIAVASERHLTQSVGDPVLKMEGSWKLPRVSISF